MEITRQKDIYNKWKELEKECDIPVRNHIPGKKIEPKVLCFKKMEELIKYRKWVFAYCLELLDPAERFDLRYYVNGDEIKCKCDTVDCTKCLLVNCKDNDCYYHPIGKKEDFRTKYTNR